jgi:hypothetical protein
MLLFLDIHRMLLFVHHALGTMVLSVDHVDHATVF